MKMQTHARTAWRSVACAAIVGLFAINAGATTILVSKGTISAGTDTTGVFGAPGADLTGKAYKLMIAYDGFTGAFHSSSPTFEKESGRMTGAVSATVAGQTFTPVVAQSFGAFLYVNNNGSFSELTGFQSGNDAQGQNVYAAHDLSSTSGTVAGPSIALSGYSAAPGDVGAVKFTTSGPEGRATFSATPSAAFVVFPPAELITSLLTSVNGLALQQGIATSLAAKLNAAQASLATGDTVAAAQAVTDFINEVNAQSGKHVPAASASALVGQARGILFSIGVIYS